MARYFRRRPATNYNQLHDEFLRDLTRQAEDVLRQLSAQFSAQLQSQSAEIMRGIVAGNVGLNTSGGTTGGIGGISQLASTGIRYLFSRPRTSRDTAETSRSVGSESSFRLSRAQALAEAGVTIGKGEKNL